MLDLFNAGAMPVFLANSLLVEINEKNICLKVFNTFLAPEVRRDMRAERFFLGL
jgi:hypothetical protein